MSINQAVASNNSHNNVHIVYFLIAAVYNILLFPCCSYVPALLKLLLGVILVVAYPVLSPYIPTSYFYTDDYKVYQLNTPTYTYNNNNT